jgi:hypothetical protein
MTESTGDGAALVAAFAGTAFALGAAAGGAVCPNAIPTTNPSVAKPANAKNLSFM